MKYLFLALDEGEKNSFAGPVSCEVSMIIYHKFCFNPPPHLPFEDAINVTWKLKIA